MKIAIYILCWSLILISCGGNNGEAIYEIDTYVSNIQNRNDLIKSRTTVNPKDLEDESWDKQVIYGLKGHNGEIFQIIDEQSLVSQLKRKYEFYFKTDTLIFARMLEFGISVNDTIVNSKSYFSGSNSIKQIDFKANKMDPEIVKQASEFYFYYVKQTWD